MSDPHLEQAFNLIKKAIDDAYARGKRDAMQAIISAATGAAPTSNNSPSMELPEVKDRKRAPRGSVEQLVQRVLTEKIHGATITDFMVARRHNDFESMIQASSIRGELRRGEKEQKYKEDNGKWFLGVFA